MEHKPLSFGANELKLLSFAGHEAIGVVVPVWDIRGRKLHVGKIGDAITAKAWIEGAPIYNVFASLDALYAWVEDMSNSLDTVEGEIDTVEIDLAA